jgi:hypothetical protein
MWYIYCWLDATVGLNEQLMNIQINEGQKIAKNAFENLSYFFSACKQTMHRENDYREALCAFRNHTFVFSPGKVDTLLAFGPRTAYSLYCGHSTFTCLPSSQDNMYLTPFCRSLHLTAILRLCIVAHFSRTSTACINSFKDKVTELFNHICFLTHSSNCMSCNVTTTAGVKLHIITYRK